MSRNSSFALLAISSLMVLTFIMIGSGVVAAEQNTSKQVIERPLNVLCSFHPIYVFAANVIGDRTNVKLECLLPPNTDPHDYALTPGDMKKIAKADLFFLNGLGIEEFLGKAVNEANPKIKVIDTSNGIEPILTRGAENQSGKQKGENQHGKYNPHIWVSPKSAIIQVKNIENAMSAADPANATVYKSNAAKYIAKLQSIIDDLTKASKTFKSNKIMTFHDAFDYFARDFGLEVVGVVEVVPGQEPSAGELAKIVKTIKNTGAAAVFSEPQYPAKTAEVIAKEANVPVYQLDPGHTGELKPDDYEKAMRKNLEVLKKALGGVK